MKITTSVMTITPDLARELLSHNKRNRPVSDSSVKKYAAAMSRGEWRLNGEPIIFGDDGCISSGQHRLIACVLSGCSFETLVVRNVETDSFSTLDSHRPRSAGDALAINSYKNYNIVSAAARAFIRLRSYGSAVNEITTPMIIDCVERNESITKWSSPYSTVRPKLFGAYIIGIIASIDNLHGHDLAATFYDKAVLGVNLHQNDPEFLLRNRVSNKRPGFKTTDTMMFQLAIKAANARISGKSLALLKMSDGEKSPVLFGINKITS